jgi:hypothetical protein
MLGASKICLHVHSPNALAHDAYDAIRDPLAWRLPPSAPLLADLHSVLPALAVRHTPRIHLSALAV